MVVYLEMNGRSFFCLPLRRLVVLLFVIGVLFCPMAQLGFSNENTKDATVSAPTKFWSFDHDEEDALTTLGIAGVAEGVTGKSALFDGRSVMKCQSLQFVEDRHRSIALSMWVNPYRLTGEQQILAAKNVYSQGYREWSLMIDRDFQFCLYVYQNGWKVLRSEVKPICGHWYQVGMVIEKNRAQLWVNGEIVSSSELTVPLPNTPAPLTLAGVDDGGKIWQCFEGAIDDVSLWNRDIESSEMASVFKPVTQIHRVPEALKAFELWNGSELPVASEIELLKGVDFRVIKHYEPKVDGYKFLHGVAIAWHNDRLYASFGHNQGSENTLTEEGRFCFSDDGGNTWSPVTTMDAGKERDDLAVSHGVFLSHAGTLWAFLGSFFGTRQAVHTRAYTLDEVDGQWTPRGRIIDGGFWPMTEPVRMGNGNWVMPGFIVGEGNPPAVAISEGDDFLSWQLKVIPVAAEVRQHWGESSLVVSDNQLLNVARYGAQSVALVSQSVDFGSHWSMSRPSNFPMATSKPCCGVLSNGVRYLIGSSSADGGSRRSPLTIALGRPGENAFSRLYVIRHALFDDGPGESHVNAALSYPYATEHAGHLYVGYSNDGSRRANHNSAELAIIPLESLVVD